MKMLLAVLMVSITTLSWTQVEISGNLTSTYISVGGAPKEHHVAPQIMASQIFYLIKMDTITNSQKPFEVTTDSLGNFHLKLPEGIYYPSLTIELQTPDTNDMIRMGTIHSVNWSINNQSFLRVQKQIAFVQINRHESHICYKCP